MNTSTGPASWLCLLCAAGALLACEDEGGEGVEPTPLELPAVPEPTYTDGHWSVEQRGITLDSKVVPLIVDAGNAGISVGTINDDFGLLVLNRPYVEPIGRGADFTSNGCPDTSASLPDGSSMLPRGTSECILEELERARGLSFDRIAVNVDLITPSRRGVLHQEFDRGDSEPRFGSPEHREQVVAAFSDLAGLADLESITFGVELNRYYHLRLPKVEGGEPLRVTDDYANLVTLYREARAAVHAVNPDIDFGPGISWSVFMLRTVPEVATEFGLDLADSMQLTEAVWRAWKRTVEPFLYQRVGSATERSAELLGVAMVPSKNEDPYNGDPAPDPDDADNDEERARLQTQVDAILAHHLYLPVVADGLPVAITRIDWPIDNAAFGNEKGAYLRTLKRAISHVDVAWAAWRRAADLQGTVDASNECRGYVESSDAQFAYPRDFCFSGMVDERAKARQVGGEPTTIFEEFAAE